MSSTNKPENFRAWLDALRSGEFNQTTGALQHSVDTEDFLAGHCCLGVACEISGVGKWEPVGDSVHTVGYVVNDKREDSLLPSAVLDWLGISTSDAIRAAGGEPVWSLRVASRYGDETESAAEANDAGLGFEELADLLEQEYLND